MTITKKQTLLNRIRELENKIKEQREMCAQYRLSCIYLAFDVEASKRERDQARKELALLQESLLDGFEGGREVGTV